MIRFCSPETVSDRRSVTPAAERSDNFQMSAPGYKPPEHNDRMIHMIKNLKNNIVIIELFFAPFDRIHLKYPFRYSKEEYYTYEYTVTEEDVAAGEFTSRVNVMFNGEEIDYGALFEETLTLTVKTGSDSSSVDAAPEKNPATGNEIYSVAILAGAAAAIAFASRKRR